MSMFVFLGPTLPVADARKELNAVYLPPITQGDLTRLAWQEPDAVGIIDGCFERMPAVWHKEILWAMERGIHVFGAASMGALRAAELSPFGMEGVGRVFEQYQSGALEDDDDVAVAHAGADEGYRRLSEAMVDVRATVFRAVEEGVLPEDIGTALEVIAKRLFYPERIYPSIVATARSQGLNADALDAFARWVPSGAVELKRQDAISLLRVMRSRSEAGWHAKRVDYITERTSSWERVLDGTQWGPLRALEGVESASEKIMDELRLDPPRYQDVLRGALLRYFVVREAAEADTAVGAGELRAAANDFRSARRLDRATDLEHWLCENRLTRHQFVDLVREELLLDRATRGLRAPMMLHMFNHLRATGAFEELAERAVRKDQALQATGFADASLVEAAVEESELFEWYFSDQLCQPEIGSVSHHSPRVGFATVDDFRRAVFREFCYVNRCGGRPFHREDRSAG